MRTLAPVLLGEAEAFLQSRLEGTNVVQMYLERFPGEGEDRAMAIRTDLADALHHAAPQLSPATTVREISVVAMPSSPEVQEQLLAAAPETRIVQDDLADEILFYREDPDVAVGQLPHMAAEVREIYREGAAIEPGLLHSRIDITEWRPAAVHSS